MEQLEHLAAGLVHDGHDGHALLGSEASDAAHHVKRGGAVEATGRLVQEEQPWPGENLQADAQPLPLPAADAFGCATANACVQRAREAHLLDRVVGAGKLLGHYHGVRQLDLRRVVDGLSHSERCHQHVLLGNISLEQKIVSTNLL